jgi:hypothetical protein
LGDGRGRRAGIRDHLAWPGRSVRGDGGVPARAAAALVQKFRGTFRQPIGLAPDLRDDAKTPLETTAAIRAILISRASSR